MFLQSPSLSDGTPRSVITGPLRGCVGSLDGACIEKLLLHCATAIETNDVTLAQQVMWVLNNVASPIGDSNQRLASWFLRALVSRSSRVCHTTMNSDGGSAFPRRLMTVTELAGYVDLIPWHRFGFSASNSAIFDAVRGYPKVHILDFSITHCMQWPTLIDALAKRAEGPPSVRITVPVFRPPVPPLLNVSTAEVGHRLANFAKFRDVPFEFRMIGDDRFKSLSSHLTRSELDLGDHEALVINCQNWLRYLSDETKWSSGTKDPSLRDTFLDIIKNLNPRIVVVVDEDCNLSDSSLASRITTCFNYLWIPFDALETFLPKDSCQRLEYETDIGHKIENIVGLDGFQRIERLESGAKLSQRMKNAGFFGVRFREETVNEVKSLLDEHASGWGMKKEEVMLVLTWKGHSSVFASAWVSTEPDIS
ncbi:hypothetical protein V6N13_117293 [Hibiscus sabdariffa]|uniref:Scarecrow-like protein 32 n=1 Tax=Hibiscus sabdariffa TaxID=183260 RepID=A0ABR2PA43_9ROSI